MHTYTSKHYSKLVDEMIDDCLQQASMHPYTIYYLIVDNKKYYEEIVLRKQPTLFNVEILTLSDLCKKILDRHHLYPQKLTTKDLMLEIVRYNKNHPDSLFHDAINPYLTAINILDVLKNIYLYDVQLSSSSLPELSQKKIATLFDIYNTVHIENMYHFDTVINCIDNQDVGHYYVMIDLEKQKHRDIISKLDEVGSVSLLEANVESIEDYSDYVTQHLFDTYSSKADFNHPYTVLTAASIEEEVKQVVYDLFLKLENHTFKDFGIYYPSEIYYQYLSKYLKKFNIAYNSHEQVINYAYKAFHCLLEYLDDGDEGHLVEAVSSHYLKAFQDHLQVSLVESMYASHHYVSHASYATIKGILDSYSTLSHVDDFVDHLKRFIKDQFISDDESISLLSLLDSISSPDEITVHALIQLLDSLVSSSTKQIKECVDSVYLLSYAQPYSELLGIKHVYMLGMNETVVPTAFKNTNMILNQEASLLHYPTTYDLLAHHQKQLEKVFSNKHESILLSYALMDNGGSTLVVSSIIKKLCQLLDIKAMKKRQLLHPAFKEEIYLVGQYDASEGSLNQDIEIFKTTHNQIPHLIDDVEHRPLSISKLEMYNQCPYKYFNQYVLHINKIRNNTIYSNEVGSLVHYVLEHCAHYFKRYIASDKKNLEADIQKQVENYIAEHPSNKYNLPQNKFILEMVSNDLYNTIMVLSKQMEKGLFTLASCEQRVINTMGNIELKGFIDRVDIFDNTIKIIDYKSSKKELNMNLARQGFKIQMLVYLDMLSRSNNLKPGAVLYFNTKKRLLKSEKPITEKEDAKNFYTMYQMDGICLEDVINLVDSEIEGKSEIIKVKLKKDGSPDAKSKVVSHEELQETLQAIAELIENLYRNMQEGIYDIYPTRSLNSGIDMTVNPCTFCEYRSLCHYDIFYNEDRMIGKEEDHED